MGMFNIPEKDTDNRPYSQNVVAPSGWGYVDLSFNFKLDEVGITCKSLTFDGSRDLNGTANVGTFTETFQKSDFTKIASPVASDFTNNIKWRRIDFEPAFDYVVVGGRFSIASAVSNHACLWCVGAPDIDKSLGGSHHFMVEKSLSHVTPDQSFIADGRTAKRMNYNATYHYNKLSAFINHGLAESTFVEASYQIYVPPGSI